MCRPGSLLTWNFDTWISPDVGWSSASNNRMKVDLPEPDGPMRKTNSPLSILTLTSSRAGRADCLYCFVTRSRVIITARQCSRGNDAPCYCGLCGGVGEGPGPGAAVVAGVPDLCAEGVCGVAPGASGEGVGIGPVVVAFGAVGVVSGGPSVGVVDSV